MNKTIFVVALSLIAPLAHAGTGTHWGYTGHEGPENWGGLDPSYRLCATGKNQSPIDVVDVIEADLPALEIDYPRDASEILNNGHTVQANFPAGNFIMLGGHRFELKQVHFHTPSENRIEGREYPLEAHFVHADAEGNLAVIAVMFEEGRENAAVARLWKDMPMKSGERHALNVKVSPLAMLPAERDYYRFNGSLTTPPCSEGVWWQVMKTPLTLSREQVEHFSHAVHGHNNRPLQSHNARPVLQ